MHDLIAVRQLPIIEEHLKALSVDIEARVKDALSLAVTEDTVKQVKVVRADLNKQFKELEEQRKTAKRAILEPYEKFDEIYKTYVSVQFEDADAELKRKISAVENQLRQEKVEDLKSYFRELADSEHLTWLEYERGNFNANLTKSRKALHKEADEFVERVSSDVTAIEVMPDAEEILVEYKRCLRLGEAVEIVKKRREAVEQERREREHLEAMRKAEKETARRAREAAEIVAPPTMEPIKEDKDPVRTLTFTVSAPVSKLKALKKFLIDGGYEIGNY